jgi:uncharacterized protein YbjT (DUF2867 family)
MSDSAPLTTVLVTGATGFIGRRVTPELVRRGYDVRAMTRHPDDYRDQIGPTLDAALGEGARQAVTPVYGDVQEPDSLAAALDGVGVAIYLVHALGADDFERVDAESAYAFGTAAGEAGVSQIVYLGGLGQDDDDLSPHLRSRREVEGLLGSGGVPVTVLRAAVVIGDGGISWEITRQLVKNLPAMVVPKWAATRTQPIAVDDVVRYLAGVVGNEEALGRTYEIGGADQLTYLDMLEQAAEELHGHPVPIIQAPVLTPGLSSRWIGFVTDVDVATGRTLIDSMSNEVLQEDLSIRDLLPGEPMTYRDAVRRALAERREREERDGS